MTDIISLHATMLLLKLKPDVIKASILKLSIYSSPKYLKRLAKNRANYS